MDIKAKEIKAEFLSLLEITEKCSADTFSKAIIDHFDREDYPTKKLVGFTLDGAAVMLGCNQQGEGNVATGFSVRLSHFLNAYL